MASFKPSAILSEEFGSELILADDKEQEEHYHVVAEVDVGGAHYAFLRQHGDSDDEVYAFRVLSNGDTLVVEDVEDDNEWERIADVCRELICGS